MGPRSAERTLTTMSEKAVAVTFDDRVHTLEVKGRPSLTFPGASARVTTVRELETYGADRWTKTPSRAIA